MRTFAEAEWDRAGKALGSAEKLAQSDPDSAASRGYYAAFHGLTAVFALRGQSFARHSAIRAALHRDLIRPGILHADVGRDYDFLMELREIGDYGGLTGVSPEDAALAVTTAGRFLAAIEPLMRMA